MTLNVRHIAALQGVSSYTFVDDSFAHFYATVISSSEREATYVLDGIMHNNVVKSDIHSTDSHGLTEAMFGLMHMTKVTFAPRFKNLSDQTLYGFKSTKSNKGDFIVPKKYIKTELIIQNYYDILRFAATIKLRYVSSSQLFKRLNSYSKQHILYKSLKEFGRLRKTLFILRYMYDVEFRQAIQSELLKHNKSGVAGNIGKIISAVGEVVPLAGGAAKAFGAVIAAIDYNKQNQKIEHLANLSASVVDMDNIAKIVALELVKHGRHNVSKNADIDSEKILNTIFDGKIKPGEDIVADIVRAVTGKIIKIGESPNMAATSAPAIELVPGSDNPLFKELMAATAKRKHDIEQQQQEKEIKAATPGAARIDGLTKADVESIIKEVTGGVSLEVINFLKKTYEESMCRGKATEKAAKQTSVGLMAELAMVLNGRASDNNLVKPSSLVFTGTPAATQTAVSRASHRGSENSDLQLQVNQLKAERNVVSIIDTVFIGLTTNLPKQLALKDNLKRAINGNADINQGLQKNLSALNQAGINDAAGKLTEVLKDAGVLHNSKLLKRKSHTSINQPTQDELASAIDSWANKFNQNKADRTRTRG